MIRSYSKGLLTVSIVSHGQADIVNKLISDLNKLDLNLSKIIIVCNLAESRDDFLPSQYPVEFLINDSPMGFGENHNLAFSKCDTEFFVIVNPDIRIKSFDLQFLLLPFSNPQIGAVAPIVLSPEGTVEDSARKFPTLINLIGRRLNSKTVLDYKIVDNIFFVDWVAGMFIVFRSDLYCRISGFDSKNFYMYFEDVDICRRIYNLGYEIAVQPKVQVYHDARRDSAKKIKYLIWHVTSAFKYFLKWTSVV